MDRENINPAATEAEGKDRTPHEPTWEEAASDLRRRLPLDNPPAMGVWRVLHDLASMVGHPEWVQRLSPREAALRSEQMRAVAEMQARFEREREETARLDRLRLDLHNGIWTMTDQVDYMLEIIAGIKGSTGKSTLTAYLETRHNMLAHPSAVHFDLNPATTSPGEMVAMNPPAEMVAALGHSLLVESARTFTTPGYGREAVTVLDVYRALQAAETEGYVLSGGDLWRLIPVNPWGGPTIVGYISGKGRTSDLSAKIVRTVVEGVMLHHRVGYIDTGNELSSSPHEEVARQGTGATIVALAHENRGEREEAERTLRAILPTREVLRRQSDHLADTAFIVVLGLMPGESIKDYSRFAPDHDPNRWYGVPYDPVMAGRPLVSWGELMPHTRDALDIILHDLLNRNLQSPLPKERLESQRRLTVVRRSNPALSRSSDDPTAGATDSNAV